MPGQAFYGRFLREIFACDRIPATPKWSDDPCFTQQTEGLTRGITSRSTQHAQMTRDR